MRRQNRKLLMRIIFTSIFIIFATVFVYLPSKSELAGALSFLTDMDNFHLNKISDSISLDKAYPVTDETGMKSNNTLFEVVNNTKEDKTYNIYFKSVENNTDVNYLDLTNIRYSISINGGEYSTPKNVNTDGIIEVNTTKSNTIDSYSLKIWVDYNANDSIYGKIFSSTLYIG